MGKNVLILHHDDRDGFMSAAVIKYYLTSNKSSQFSDLAIITKSINYEQPIKEIFNQCLLSLKKEKTHEDDFSKVYLVDYSISNEQNEKGILEINEKYDLIWIDHHASSIQCVLKNTELNKIKGMRIVGLSGAALCWLFYHKDIQMFCERLKDYENNVDGVSKSFALSILEEADTPIFVLYTHRYDIFDLNDTVLQFNYGYTDLDVDKMLEHIDPKYQNYDLDEFEFAVKTGDTIKKYVDNQNKILVKGYGVEATFKDGERTYRCLTLNNPVFTSLVYGAVIGDYDFVVSYARKQKVWRYSLYTVKDDINVSDIARKYDGGGHPKAAGFTSDKPLWEYKEWEFD